MQALLLTGFSWLSHYAQSYVLLKQPMTSISESMVFPTCVNSVVNQYDVLGFISIHLVFTKFIYMLRYLYINPGILFQNQTIESVRQKRLIISSKIGIWLTIVGIYLMYFTTYTIDGNNGSSEARRVLTEMHMACVVLIVLGTFLLCSVMIRGIWINVYTWLFSCYMLVISILGGIFIHTYIHHGYDEAVSFMGIGEFEILYFTFVYYLLSIRTYVDGNIHNTICSNVEALLGICFLNLLIGPICYSCLNCFL